MTKARLKHYIVQCGGGKKVSKKSNTINGAAKLAMKAVDKPKGPRICIVRPVVMQCTKHVKGKCQKKKLAMLDPVYSAARTARGVKGTFRG